MGNSSHKLAEKCPILQKSEVSLVANSFKFASRNSQQIKEDDLLKFWTGSLDPRLGQFLANFLFGPSRDPSSHCPFQKYAELFCFTTRGTIDERTNLLYYVVGSDPLNPEIAYPPIREFVEAVCSSFLRAIKLQNGPEYQSWETKGFRICSEFVQKLAESLSSDMNVQRSAQKVARSEVENWFQRNPSFGFMLAYVFTHLYSLRPPQKQSSDDIKEESLRKYIQLDCLLPFCEGLEYVPDYPAFIDLSQLIFINSNLPAKHRNKWRFLFSCHLHGESFSTLLGRIIEQGPTVMIVEDTSGHIFGGYASESWKISPNWCGDNSAFLFTLKPKMRCFPATNHNDHYQYLNSNVKTMPNGIGMGGQHDYWGLYLDQEYGKGECSPSCTTYQNYTQLSANKEFNIRQIEVWGVGDKLESEEPTEREKRSVLDDNSEARAMMKIAGIKEYSEGLREEPEN